MVLRNRHRCCSLLLPVLAVLLAAGCSPVDAPHPPEQPSAGPGGADYPHASVTETRLTWNSLECRVYEPADPAPASAPLVVFLHGWPQFTWHLHGRWIEHIVRKGNIVVFPRYQDGLLESGDRMYANVARAAAAAGELLASGSHVRPEPGMALIGYSCGAELAVQVAAHASQWGLPPARAILCVHPYTGAIATDTPGAPLADLAGIPPDALVAVMVGHPDSLVGDAGGRSIYGRLTSVPAANKNYVIISSDNHGWPALIADHVGPVALDTDSPAENSWDLLLRTAVPVAGWGWTDALDFYGYWKIFDGLRDAAFRSTHREYALGDTPEQRFMGAWSDGVPVRPLVVVSPP